jgi:hypothetical protein
VDEPVDITAPPGGRPAVAGVNRSFPLIALVQLATFCAALMACIDGGKFRDFLEDVPQLAGPAVAGFVGAMFVGGFLGLMLGLGEHHVWRSALKGMCIGALCGVAMMFVYVAPAPLPQAAAAAVVLLLSTIIMRVGTP